jgi:hypothetical protein
LAALLLILSSVLVGLVLVVAPWTPLWESNWLLTLWPAARELVLNAFTRGAVTGLGLVNLLLAAHDLYLRLADAGAGAGE